MPTVAAYWVVSDATVEFGPASAGPPPGVSDHHFTPFGPLNVAPTFPLCILAFKVNPT